MSIPALVVPRLEIDVIDKNGKMDRNWYKFFALMAKSVGPSTSNTDDLQSLLDNAEIAEVDSATLVQRIVDDQLLSLENDLSALPNDDAMMLALDQDSAGGTSAAPSAKVGLTVVAGSAATLMRSDASPPIDQAITPTWTGLHAFSARASVSTSTLTTALTVNAATAGGAEAIDINSAAATPSFIAYLINAVASAYVGQAGAANNLIAGSVAGDHMIRIVSGNLLVSTDNGATIELKLSTAGDLTVKAGGGNLMATTTALTNGAGASAGTLTNAPAAGNPTKWIQINDNGTVRKVPAW